MVPPVGWLPLRARSGFDASRLNAVWACAGSDRACRDRLQPACDCARIRSRAHHAPGVCETVSSGGEVALDAVDTFPEHDLDQFGSPAEDHDVHSLSGFRCAHLYFLDVHQAICSDPWGLHAMHGDPIPGPNHRFRHSNANCCKVASHLWRLTLQFSRAGVAVSREGTRKRAALSGVGCNGWLGTRSPSLQLEQKFIRSHISTKFVVMRLQRYHQRLQNLELWPYPGVLLIKSSC